MAAMTRDQLLQMYVKERAGHVLDIVDDTGLVRAWYIRRPGTGMYRSLILDTPEGVVITGDSPDRAMGCGRQLRWFVAENGPRYLASKFLTQVWCPDIAEAHVAKLVSESGPDDSWVAEIVVAMTETDWTQHSYLESVAWILEDAGFDTDGVWPDHGYDAVDEAVLAAIQQRFRDLFWDHYISIGPDGVPIRAR